MKKKKGIKNIQPVMNNNDVYHIKPMFIMIRILPFLSSPAEF